MENPISNDRVIAALSQLIETSKDGERGFALAAKDARAPQLTLVFKEAEKSCRASAGNLQEQVRRLGGQAEKSGSVKGSVHRSWLSFKSTISPRNDKGILEECERGEDFAKARYAQVLKLDLPEPARSIVERQYQGVIANHDRVRDLRNQFSDSSSRPIQSNV